MNSEANTGAAIEGLAAEQRRSVIEETTMLADKWPKDSRQVSSEPWLWDFVEQAPTSSRCSASK